MLIRPLNCDLASDEMSDFCFHLTHDRFFLPDLMRDYDLLVDTIKEVFDKSTIPAGIYDGDKLSGVFFITDIMPEHQARLLFWGWGKVNTPTVLRGLKHYVARTAETYKLKRIYAQTPDRKLVHFLNHLGFRDEGRFKCAFKYLGKLYTLHNLRLLEG